MNIIVADHKLILSPFTCILICILFMEFLYCFVLGICLPLMVDIFSIKQCMSVLEYGFETAFLTKKKKNKNKKIVIMKFWPHHKDVV